jgi:hypothetical protein
MPSITTRQEIFRIMDLMLRKKAPLQLFGHKQQHLHARQPTRISCDKDRNVSKEELTQCCVGQSKSYQSIRW